MKKILIGMVLITILMTNVAFAGQCTGGDKRRATTGLNPQPLPPGRHPLYRRTHRHKHRRQITTAYSPQWGGFRHRRSSSSKNKPN